MGGRLIDFVGQGLAADRPLASGMAVKLSPGALAFYYAHDTAVLSVFDSLNTVWTGAAGVPYSDEQVRDAIGAALVQGTGITVVVNDAGDTITVNCTITQYTNGMADARITAANIPGAITAAILGASINALADVDTATTPPTNGQALIWDNTAGLWKPGTVAGGGGATHPGLLAHRWWAVFFAGSRFFGTAVAEFQMRATPGGANQCTGGTPFSSDSIGGGFTETSAFNGVITDAWVSSQNGTNGYFYSPTHLGYDFGAGNSKVVQEITLSARDVTGGSQANEQTPQRGKIMYSDTGLIFFPAFEYAFTTIFAFAEVRVIKNQLV